MDRDVNIRFLQIYYKGLNDELNLITDPVNKSDYWGLRAYNIGKADAIGCDDVMSLSYQSDAQILARIYDTDYKYKLIHFESSKNKNIENLTSTGLIMAEGNNMDGFLEIMIGNDKLHDGIWSVYWLNESGIWESIYLRNNYNK